jgi:hypothetical protein
MKRDMDLIRKILLFAEEHCRYTEKESPRIKIDGYSLYDISFHIALLREEEMVFAESSGTVEDTNRSRFTTITTLTWKGYDFLDKIRDQTQTKSDT